MPLVEHATQLTSAVGPDVLNARAALALAQARLGDPVAAEPQVRATLAGLAELGLENSIQHALAALHLAEILRLRGETSESARWHQQAEAQMVRLLGNDHPRVASLRAGVSPP